MDPLAIDGTADLPPSCRHVAHALQEAGPLTQPELIELTTLPKATVDDALQRLVNDSLVTPVHRGCDARGRLYRFDP